MGEHHMKDLNIIVLYGGEGGEREVSLRSGEAVHRAILKCWDSTNLVDMRGLRLPESIRDDNTIIFPVLHGGFGEDGRLQDLLDKQGVIYAGSCARASRNCINKSITKDLALAAGLKVVPGFTFNPLDDVDIDSELKKLGDDIVVKPADGGSSMGLGFIKGKKQIINFLEKLPAGDWIIEKRIHGRELSVGILNGKALGVVEILPRTGSYDYAHKYTNGMTDYVYPAKITDKMHTAITTASETIFRACSCRDFARADFILKENGKRWEIFVLEINTLPGMTENSLLPMSALCTGRDFDGLVGEMLAPAIGRFQKKWA
jgi:D-alanine-D-alanine ligase